MTEFKAGSVCIVGAPNTGKSSLLNNILGYRAQAVSPKPETTKKALLGVKTTKNFQIGFVDTPGITFRPTTQLETLVTKEAYSAIYGSDVCYLLVDRVYSEAFLPVLKVLKSEKIPTILVITKEDILKKNKILEIILSFQAVHSFAEFIPISNVTLKNIDKLIELTLPYFKVSELIYPADYNSSQTYQEYILSFVHEQLLKLYDKEIPYKVAVSLEGTQELGAKTVFFVKIVCQKPGQKAILIGKNGSAINLLKKNLAMQVREELKQKVEFDIVVSVSENFEKLMLKNWKEE